MNDRDAAPPAGAPTFASWCALAAAGLLARAVHLRDGLFHGPAFPWLGGACLCAVLPWLVPARVRGRAVRERTFVALGAAILVWQFVALFRHRIASLTAEEHGVVAPWWATGALAAGAAASLAVVLDVKPRAAFGVALAAFLVVGLWIVAAVPSPHIDVWHFQQAGCAAMLRGESPYAASIVDIYDNPAGYGPGLVQDGRVLIGFQYPPVVFWADLAAYVATGDYRYAHVFAWPLAALLFAAATRDRAGRVAALVFLFMPRAFFVLEFGWPEPVVACLLAATLYAARRAPRALPWVAGTFFASRQYFVAGLPAALALIDRPRSAAAVLRFAAKAALAGGALTLPLFLRDPASFAKCVWRVQAAMPPRPDALSFLALWADGHGGTFPPYWIGFALLWAVLWLALARGAAGAGGFAAALGAGYALFFAFNKFAFCNYYVAVFAGLVGAAISVRSRPEDLPR